jgi:hypothetical protein
MTLSTAADSLRDDKGQLSAPLAPGVWELPRKIRLDRGYLVYDRLGEATGLRTYAADGMALEHFRVTDKRLLGRFLQLITADDAAILTFAREYGPLRVDVRNAFTRHDLANVGLACVQLPTHARNATEAELAVMVDDVLPCALDQVPGDAPHVAVVMWVHSLLEQHGYGDALEELRWRVAAGEQPVPTIAGRSAEQAESLAEWRAWSARAQSVVNLLAALRSGELGNDADWRRIEAGQTAGDRIEAAAHGEQSAARWEEGSGAGAALWGFGTSLNTPRVGWVLTDWARQAGLVPSLVPVAAFRQHQRRARLFDLQLLVPSAFAAISVSNSFRRLDATRRICRQPGRSNGHPLSVELALDRNSAPMEQASP